MGTPRWLAAALILAWMAPQVQARQAGNPAQAPAPYGPVLYVHGKPVTGPAQRDPAEVHDEADSGANPAAQPSAPPSGEAQTSQQQQQRQKQQAARRHPAWQAQNEAMAPRPLHGGAAPAQGLPIPAPGAAPQPVVPSSNVINSCQGGQCRDASGNTYNGIGSGNAGVNSSGRLCSRTGATVQCF